MDISLQRIALLRRFVLMHAPTEQVKRLALVSQLVIHGIAYVAAAVTC